MNFPDSYGFEPGKKIIQKKINFNWKEYLIANTDLIEIGINNEELAKNHWNQKGRYEKREVKSSNFDWTQYIAINQDLIEQGYITKEKAEQHYIYSGFSEGRRTILKDFDWNFYVSYNNHLIHTGINTQSKAIKHWIQYGKGEGLLTHIKPIEEAYMKMLTHDYSNIYDIFNINNITIYNTATESDSTLEESKLHYINSRNSPMFKPLESSSDIRTTLLQYNELLLIIDFPCFGGGCSFFINSIISHYKYRTNFLIVRNFKGNMYWYLNDDIIFSPHMNVEQSIFFLYEIQNKISKIFFNSIVDHDKHFIDSVLTLNKEKTILTHDYTLFFKKPQLYFYEINDTQVEHKINIHQFSRVITQHIGNLHTFGKYMDGYSNIVVSALPDFKSSSKEVINNNEIFTIGIIGDISDVKGYVIVNELFNTIKDNSKVQLVVFGKVHIKGITNQHSYQTIKDLNVLLETHKPNILLETSLWPESFSFTLSLAMITNLPILYQNKYYTSTIQRRLSLYNKAYPFNKISDIPIQSIIEKGQKRFFLIKPVIYFPPFWDYYFANNNHLQCKLLNQDYNIVLLTSKIYTLQKPLSYAPHRSIYTPEERFQQTLKTIKCVREKIPNSFIVIFDNSILSDYEFQTINNLVDIFINKLNDGIVNELTNNSVHKAFGEIAQTYRMLEYLRIYYKNMKINNIFKLTGRYLLNNNFDYNKFNNPNIIFKRNNLVEDRAYYFTCFYKIGKAKLGLYYDIMTELFEDIQKNHYEYEEWEVLLPTLLYKEFDTIDVLGVTQDIAVWKDRSEI